MMNSKELQAAETLIRLALDEDVANIGDITTDNLIPAETRRKAYMVAKADGVIAGLPIAEMVFRQLDQSLVWEPQVEEGAKVTNGTVLVRFEASYRALLTAERTALNFFQRLSGIATMAGKYAEAVKDTKTVILDTRKTLPGFRMLDKYAVKTGGATNHRIGLFDMVMIKDNHIEVAGGITPAVEQIKAKIPAEIKIEVETTTLEQVQEALNAGADIIMLDNMDNATMSKAVAMINGKAKVEASGNMTLERLKEVAATGVDYISIGALTHSVQAMDISQRLEE
ncbi:carboxylating nicotinate-nucleotide diphosphorylase [Sunxiuqinia elliptica]|uniref:Probable nicotinate-nucleotide pyrophosphorylase [carboxylating] n=1 Tax=Sunxiuqinia elliptica TaxID=655355 RepID=A0A1I2F3M5_9BACT|nr:carboxylating nicotinate-nucleotide diphosphorylase [Sunxiuqinia elliptica]TDO05050.1 nicotinate-nucleotide pyrophosphorylase [carboxylating] [Sunxiuqinia elliptica]TDO64599.1 nicotinate-nucleotide pyrophosphorylase [carboxylating] [Sunxiuqinia elliptica]SFE99982.1 nicotinate-nucleotide pyrophosphorylase [carboxylating] [Sunxiuqinia elliptica]